MATVTLNQDELRNIRINTIVEWNSLPANQQEQIIEHYITRITYMTSKPFTTKLLTKITVQHAWEKQLKKSIKPLDKKCSEIADKIELLGNQAHNVAKNSPDYKTFDEQKHFVFVTKFIRMYLIYQYCSINTINKLQLDGKMPKLNKYWIEKTQPYLNHPIHKQQPPDHEIKTDEKKEKGLIKNKTDEKADETTEQLPLTTTKHDFTTIDHKQTPLQNDYESDENIYNRRTPLEEIERIIRNYHYVPIDETTPILTKLIKTESI